MFVFLVLVTAVAETYFESLKKDLAKQGFEAVLLITSISWIGCPILIGILLVMGKFQLPTDPIFYLLWFVLTLNTWIHFALFVTGLGRTRFLAAEALSSLGFVATAFYAVLFLDERLTIEGVVALIIAALGALAFLNWRTISTIQAAENLGILAILSSMLLVPLGGILYKAASLHTSSYQQFLTGRLTMDVVCYSLFLCFWFTFWHRRNPLRSIRSLLSHSRGIAYMAGWAAINLLYSWLIYELPVSLFAVLGAVSIPAGSVIGRIKYKERLKPSYILGAICISAAIALLAI